MLLSGIQDLLPGRPATLGRFPKRSHSIFNFIAPVFALVLLLTSLCVNCLASSLRAASGGQADTLQTYPVRPTPSQSAAPPDASNKDAQGPGTTRTEQYTLSPDRYGKAVAYSRAAYLLYFVSVGWSLLVLFLFLRLGFAAKLRDFAESFSGSWIVQGLVFVPLFVLVLDLLSLPLRIYRHSLSLHYEQSVQGWGSWFLDWGKEVALGVGFVLVLVLVLFAVMRRSPRRWWFYFWLAALPILMFEFFISPWFIDPLFNKFEPLEAKYPQLARSLEQVVQRAGLNIPQNRIFLMEASRKSNEINAYVTGFGASKRVVVWDNTIQKLTPDETLFIFGHEAGHYVLGHIRNGFIFFAALLLLALYLGYRGLHWALPRWGAEWRLYGVEDWASLGVIVLLFHIMEFVSMPLVSGFSRMQEHAADVYGLEVIHGIVPNSEEVAAHAFQVLGEVDLADPNPPAIITFWLYSHPPLAERLVFAHSYDPWSKGKPARYVNTPAR
jgi:STE24 endopeptidase